MTSSGASSRKKFRIKYRAALFTRQILYRNKYNDLVLTLTLTDDLDFRDGATKCDDVSSEAAKHQV